MAGSQQFRLGVLGSGQGSNFVAIAEACAAGNHSGAGGTGHQRRTNGGHPAARQRTGHSLPASYLLASIAHGSKKRTEQQYIDALREARVDLIVLAGFMRVLKDGFLNAFAGRIVNIPPFPAAVVPRVWRHGNRRSIMGSKSRAAQSIMSMRESIPALSSAQQSVPVLDSDTPETLHQRIHAAEHQLYPECVAAVARGAIRIERPPCPACLSGRVAGGGSSRV